MPWVYNYSSISLVESLAKRSSNVDPNDVDFQNSCISQASAYQSNLFNLQTLLASLGSDKGLKFYDSTNDLETLLKEIVDLNKSALGDISVIVDEMPILGPLLGPSKSFHVEGRNSSDLAAQLFTKWNVSWIIFSTCAKTWLMRQSTPFNLFWRLSLDKQRRCLAAWAFIL